MGQTEQEEAPGLTLADRLEAAMASKGITANRGLAVKLAGGTADKAQVERWRKQVKRMRSGRQKTVQKATAERLSEVLDVPVRYWPTERSLRPRTPLELAEEMLMRLEEGERVAADALEAAALPLEVTASLYGSIAARLRASAAAAGSTP